MNVESSAFTRQTMFLENHPYMMIHEQGRWIKDFYCRSNASLLNLRLNLIEKSDIHFNGERTLSFGDMGLDITNSFGYLDFSIQDIIQRRAESQRKIIERTDVVFTNHVSTYNIFHFMCEVLPSLWLFRKELKSKSIVLVGSADSNFVQEILDILDLNVTAEIVPIGADVIFNKSMRLDFVPFRVYPIAILKEIRDYVVNKYSKSQSEKQEIVYVARGDKTRNRRKIVNEKQVIEYLTKEFGSLCIVKPGLTPLDETIQKLCNARIVIGATGGSLINLLWAGKLQTFLEIVPETYPGATETEDLSRWINFEYHRIPSANLGGSLSFASIDQVVNLEELFRIKHVLKI